jgi:hypothetical protein
MTKVIPQFLNLSNTVDYYIFCLDFDFSWQGTTD